MRSVVWEEVLNGMGSMRGMLGEVGGRVRVLGGRGLELACMKVLGDRALV